MMTVLWGAMPFFFLDPFYGVVYYSLINIIRPEQLLWGGGVGRIYLGAQLMIFLSWLANKEKLQPEYTPLPFEIILLWILAFEMTLNTYTVSYNSDVSWHWTSGFIKATIFCFVITKTMNSPQKLERYYAVVLVWFTLLAIWGFQQKLGGNDRMEGLGGQQLPDINGLACVYVLYFPLTYYSMLSRTKWVKFWIGIPSFIVFTIFILFTDSRGAFLGMAVCMLMIFLRTPLLQKFKMVFTLLIVGTLLIGVLSQLAPQGFFESYQARLATMLGQENETTGEVEYEGSAAGRTAMWKGAIAVYRNHPEYWFFGVGMYCYSLMYHLHFDEISAVIPPEIFLSQIYRGGRGGKELHNTYLSVLMGGGVIILLTWLFLIVAALVKAHRIPSTCPQIIEGIDLHNYARAIEVGIIGYCVSITFVNMEFIDFFYWHLIMPGVLLNLGMAHVKKEALGLLDDDILPDSTVKRSLYGMSH